MRVTRPIREYIEKSIGEKFDPQIEKAREIQNPAVKEALDAIRELAKQANEQAIKIAQDAGVFNNKTAYGAVTENPQLIAVCTYVGNYVRDIETDNKRTKMISDLNAKKRAVIEDIILSLELGEKTKGELRDLIDKVEV